MITANVRKRILVLGADTPAGARIASVLAADPAIECIVSTREREQMPAPLEQSGAGALTLPTNDRGALRQALTDVFAVVNAGGAYEALGYAVARDCAEGGVHYADLASARPYVCGITSLNRKARRCLVVAGAAVTPAVSGALVDYLVPEFDRVHEIHCALAIDDASPGRAPADTMWRWLGAPLRTKQRGRWHHGYVWSAPARTDFPAPVGCRRAYLWDAADLVFFPERYGAHTVTFRIALAQPLLAIAMAASARWRHWRTGKRGAQANGAEATEIGWQRWGQAISAVRVVVSGERGNVERTHTVCLLARGSGGLALATGPAVALVRRWAHEGVAIAGAIPCVGLLDFDAIKDELLTEDVVLVRS
jgi:hypothetical protein